MKRFVKDWGRTLWSLLEKIKDCWDTRKEKTCRRTKSKRTATFFRDTVPNAHHIVIDRAHPFSLSWITYLKYEQSMIGYVGKSYLRKTYKWLWWQFHSDNSNADDGHDLPENGDEEAKRCRLFIILSLNCFCGGTIFLLFWWSLQMAFGQSVCHKQARVWSLDLNPWLLEIYELWIGVLTYQKDKKVWCDWFWGQWREPRKI